jgi:hypothetical protein
LNALGDSEILVSRRKEFVMPVFHPASRFELKINEPGIPPRIESRAGSTRNTD